MALDTISAQPRNEGRARRRELEEMLEQAGLELWQSPEGFWAIRLKVESAPAHRPQRDRQRAR